MPVKILLLSSINSRIFEISVRIIIVAVNICADYMAWELPYSVL